MVWRYCYKEVLPFTAMATVECLSVGINTLFKAATLKGMSYFVFILYSYTLCTLLLLPFAFIFRRSGLPPFKFSLLYRIILLGVIGFGSDMCGYNGIKYSSTTLASAFSNLTPAFTFILAVVFRMENLYFRRSSTQAKIIGTVISISGAFVAVLYKGPTLISSSKSNELHQGPLALGTTQTNWVIGGLLFASQYLLLSSWYIVQTQVMKIYPAELIVVFLFILCTTIIAVPVCLIAETNPSAWRLRLDISLVTIIFAGFFGPSFSSVVHTWGLHLKGPVYVSIFKPFSVVIAAAMGVVFLGDSLHLGSVLGAIMLSLGFYGLIWGKAKEEETAREDSYPNLGNTPLLHRHEV
ncbi:WAT1-related protein At5g40240-like isoform X1 [Ziziphus jujuba]|uniref:WAT1-related protein n=1 Tax=Ziziphus jujuba TaxID=326968 RepID=A0A6P3ZK13_ZIZJJ|nr:WAT1-related protein At5g40240-like isoform X1 [Ziziphus jujuba]XP_015879181.3 WAT1-related protein At5g40240-like isoform X1 [Ziziphus jujuba]